MHSVSSLDKRNFIHSSIITWNNCSNDFRSLSKRLFVHKFKKYFDVIGCNWISYEATRIILHNYCLFVIISKVLYKTDTVDTLQTLILLIHYIHWHCWYITNTDTVDTLHILKLLIHYVKLTLLMHYVRLTLLVLLLNATCWRHFLS